MSKTTHRETLRYAGIAGVLGALILQVSAASAAAPITIKMAPGIGGPYEGPDQAIEDAGAGHEQSVVTTITKNGKQYVVITVPTPSWRYPRPSPDELGPPDPKGGYVIAYALPDGAN